MKAEGIWEISILLNFVMNIKLLLEDEAPSFFKKITLEKYGLD